MFPLAGSDISNLKVFKTPVMWDSSAINGESLSPHSQPAQIIYMLVHETELALPPPHLVDDC
jgi:hypothetical protein